jgi:hypothetical protein
MDAPPGCCVEIFVPLIRGDGQPVAKGYLADLERRLTERFGGVTAFTRAPARGRWADDGQVQTDDVVIYEVMAPNLDRPWWGELRQRLERELDQEEVLIRAHAVERL